MGRKDPDWGLLKALADCQIPEGPALDLGAGNGRLALEMTKHRPTIAYEVDDSFGEDLGLAMAQFSETLEVRWENVLDLDPPPEPASLSIVAVGMTIYNSKDTVEELLGQAFSWLKPGGILHVDFATYDDAGYESDFAQFGCLQIAPGSFVHYNCHDPSCYRLGRNGGSFWEPDEVDALLASLGPSVFVHCQLIEWAQTVIYEDEEGKSEERQRSFYVVTVQKL